MKYLHKTFTSELKAQIHSIEKELKEQIDKLIRENKAAISKKELKLEAEFDQEGRDVFQPGYRSSISLGISEKSGDLIDLKIIKIWECKYFFLGMPVSKKISGSKLFGELLNESSQEITTELEEYMAEFLEEVNRPF
ncbi:hypothetical protein P2R12_12745 [Cytobacillus oceanisediminis]|uniref:hypothetical protein n=1 Tax=Cytobacillus oceanisediminis TaxID=665099 RepID=UPI0023DAAE65|nr:hypothetical protein [Cytobacillus oceanisediminis]MDF2037824.1 hypothetical protein [Cytobacillus oceanisediminis]